MLLQLLMGFTRLDNAPQLGMVAIIGMRVCGAPFNPMDLDLSAVDACAAVGIRMLRQGVRGVEYQNTVGLNNVVVTLPAPS